MSENKDHQEAAHHLIMINKRIEDLKWFIGVFSGSVAFLVAGLSIIVGLNLSSERSSLRDFRDEVKSQVNESLGKYAQPILALETLDGRPLNGSAVEAWLAPSSKDEPQIHFSYVIRNIGKGRSGSMFMRFYSSDVRFLDPDTDKTGYKYSTFINSTSWDPADLLGGVSMQYTSHLRIPKDFKIVEQSELLIRLYYGNGEMVDAKIKLIEKK